MLRSVNPVLALSVAAVLGVLALAGCSDSNSPGPGGGGATTSSFSGMFSGGTQSGKLSVSMNTASLAGRGIIKRAGRGIVTCTGTADFGATSVNLSGAYNTSTDDFTLSGGGYTFTGTYHAGTHGKANVEGSWVGPNDEGGGNFICYFGDSTDVSVYCGSYHSNAASMDSTGTWTFGVVDTLLAGFAFGDSAVAFEGIFFEGKLSASGNPRIININYNPAGYSIVAPGTVDTTGTDTVTGTFTFTPVAGSAVTGTYTGALCP